MHLPVSARQRTIANFGGNVMQNHYAISLALGFLEGNGRGGIRTHGGLGPKSPAYLTPPSVHTMFEVFLAAGCPKPNGFLRKNGLEGVKWFGHRKGSNPDK